MRGWSIAIPLSVLAGGLVAMPAADYDASGLAPVLTVECADCTFFSSNRMAPAMHA